MCIRSAIKCWVLVDIFVYFFLLFFSLSFFMHVFGRSVGHLLYFLLLFSSFFLLLFPVCQCFCTFPTWYWVGAFPWALVQPKGRQAEEENRR